MLNQFELTILAQLSAHREMLVTLFVYRFLQERDPLHAAHTVQNMFEVSKTVEPREGTTLDPETSVLLASMTDEAIDDIMERVIERLEFCMQDEEQEQTAHPGDQVSEMAKDLLHGNLSL